MAVPWTTVLATSRICTEILFRLPWDLNARALPGEVPGGRDTYTARLVHGSREFVVHVLGFHDCDLIIPLKKTFLVLTPSLQPKNHVPELG